MRSLKAQELDQDREIARTRPAGGGLEWKKMDLHLHTPASSDYRDPGISYLDILKKAEEKGLDMIAFTDHNSVGGYSAMHREIETLTLLERLGRMTDVERETLNEYRRLLTKIVVLPGFEFTATFGFHILGIFPENTSVRKLEYLLLNLNVPEEKMLLGAPDAGSTSDVLNAYQAITTAGGLAIAAHANSSNGVAMQGFPFGGQTKIAYTQDHNLIALEVTDLDVTGRRTTASFYNGSKPEYPRRMHIIQGSDAHSLNTEQADSMNKRLGVGARITEVLVKEASFAALKELFLSNDFTRERPHRAGGTWESVEKARLEGQTLTQSFHERVISRTARTRPILHDIVAFSNAQGGTIYVGASPDTSAPVHGIEHPNEAIHMLQEDIRRTIEPPVDVTFSTKGTAERGVLVIMVPKGSDVPYAFTPTGQIYIREGGETVVANRDEIVTLVLGAAREGMAKPTIQPQPQQTRPVLPQAQPDVAPPVTQPSGRAVPVPTQPQVPTVGRAPREEKREQAPAPETRQPQEQRNQRDNRESNNNQRTQRDQREQRPAGSVPPPAAERVSVRPPVFSNLPPEKLKGQIRPMLPSGVNQEPEPPLEMPTPIAAETIEMEMPEVLPAAPGEGLELLPTPEEEETKSESRSIRSRSRNRRDRQPATPEEAEVAVIKEVVLPEPVVEAAPAPATKPSRSRGRRKAEVAAEDPAEALAAEEVDTPMETTVSAEHLSREEIVEAEPEKPARGRSRTQRRRDKQMEVDAPTAAATETDAAAEAIMVEAEVEPGMQIPAEITEEAAEPELTSPPVKKGRSRRKSEAQKAAEVEAEIAPPADPIAQTEEEAPKKGRSRSRGRKQETPQPVEATGNAAGVPERDPDVAADAPATGVEIISTEERNGQKFHTMRDLRDGTTVHNVTRKSARRLWYYAILQHEHGDPALAEIAWHPNGAIGLWRREHRAGVLRYDLVSRYPDGSLRIFYGVTDEGLQGHWQELIEMAGGAEYWGPPPVEK
ncbi:MAG: RNA-binding domain-containing protein [Chloroflexota bacterium]